ncbi:MAG: HNH endonuclease [Ilumatobacteraceae bacterium]
MALTEAKHGHAGVTEVIVVIDADTVHHGHHPDSDIRFQNNIDVPVESVRRMLCTGVITPTMTRDGVVLDVGRTQRLATRAQRRALRVMYPTCAVPGCAVGFDHCTPHHIAWWRHGGATDLDNLIPLCSKHHHRVHDHGWQLHLTPGTRTLTVTLPDGTTMSHAPPTASPDEAAAAVDPPSVGQHTSAAFLRSADLRDECRRITARFAPSSSAPSRPGVAGQRCRSATVLLGEGLGRVECRRGDS